MKKYMIRCDIEGVSGVVSYEQAEPGKPEYDFGLRMFMADLLATVEGLHSGGADEVVIYDEHYYGRNIDPAQLPPNTTAICGKPPYRADWAGGLDRSFAGVALVGFHSKFGTPGGLLHHTYELDIRDLRIQGVSVGEIGMEAAVAGDWGVPVVLVTGDSAGVAEAKALIKGVETVTVKESANEHGGVCYPLAKTTGLIRAAAEKSVKTPPLSKPLHFAGPVTVEVELNDGPYLDAVRRKLGPEMSNDRTLVIRAATATAAWAEYWAKKVHCQKAMKGQS